MVNIILCGVCVVFFAALSSICENLLQVSMLASLMALTHALLLHAWDVNVSQVRNVCLGCPREFISSDLLLTLSLAMSLVGEVCFCLNAGDQWVEQYFAPSCAKAVVACCKHAINQSMPSFCSRHRAWSQSSSNPTVHLSTIRCASNSTVWCSSHPL